VIMRFGWGCVAALVLVIVALIRALSGNAHARYQEEQQMRSWWQRQKQAVSAWWQRRQQQRPGTQGPQQTYHQQTYRQEPPRQTQQQAQQQPPAYTVLACPSCGQHLRVPTGKGRVRVTCSRCRNSFEGRT